MLIRTRLIIAICLLFIVIMSSVSVWLYFSIEKYQRSEFSQQLADKAITVADIMFRNEQRGVNFIAQLDIETRNNLYEERVFIFDEAKKFIYGSVPYTSRSFSKTLFSKLEKKGEAKEFDDDNLVYGKLFQQGEKKLFVIISANDTYGTNTLINIRNVLVLITLIGIIIIIFFVYIIVQRLTQPLYDLSDRIEHLTENNLRQTIPQSQKGTEIAQLTESYNRMILRIADAFDNQRQFIQHASHELRTQLAVMLLELDSALLKTKEPAAQKPLASLKEELEKLIELTNSLLMLSKLTNGVTEQHRIPAVRIDEILFDVAKEAMRVHQDHKIIIEVDAIESEDLLSISANPVLLKLLFRNFMDNAYKYSENRRLAIHVGMKENRLSIQLVNDGKPIPENEQAQLFAPLFRASNSAVSSGFGVGLSIAKKIADYHNATISYAISPEGLNVFEIQFSARKENN